VIDSAVRDNVDVQLDTIEQAEDVTVLYACESGSRAWGFASRDSDYDVRFIYVHPRDWYLSLEVERRSDTVDRTPTARLDLHGWDLRKALGLLRRSNPSLIEWLQSPHVYREHDRARRLQHLRKRYYSPRAASYHYRNMAQRIARRDLDGPRVEHKTYLYAVRALLAVRWIQDEARDGPPPLTFRWLLQAEAEDEALVEAVRDLVRRKRRGRETGEGRRIEAIDAFIDRELDRLGDRPFTNDADVPPLAPLNDYFRSVLNALAETGQ
jgi:hypothetical protein